MTASLASSAFMLDEILACAFFWLVSAKTHLSESLHLRTLSCPSFLCTTKQSLDVTTIQDPVLVLHQGMLFRFFLNALLGFFFGDMWHERNVLCDMH